MTIPDRVPERGHSAPRRADEHRPGRNRARRRVTFGRWAVCIGVVIALMAATAASLSSADRWWPSQAFEIGVTHAQVAPDAWKPAAATDRAKQTLREVTDLGNQHIMGFGALNPSPAPGVRDWASLDARMRLIDSTGVVPVVTLCCAPDWMKGGAPGRTDWTRLEAPPLPEHFDDFAQLAVDVAARYRHVRHFVVWNELKGFTDESLNRWDMETYTSLYNTVYRALKAFDPTILVGGPYVPMDTWSDARVMSHPSALAGPWGVVDQRALDAVQYWLANRAGADFIAVDGHSSTKDAGLIVAPEIANDKFSEITRWLTTQTTLPIWWMEVYPDVDPAESSSSPYRADVALDALLGIGDAGGSVVFLWQPEATPSFASVGLWTSTVQEDGGQPQPLVEKLRRTRQAWSAGHSVARRWDGRELVLWTVADP